MVLGRATKSRGGRVSAGAAAGSAILAAARAYMRRGWSVIPLRAREKLPALRWQAFQKRRAGAAEIAGWLERWPAVNLGIVTGEISNLAVLDVDVRHGGAASLAELEARNGPLPKTSEVETGGGGRHLYFAMPGQMLRSRTGLASGLDLRAEGGLVVAPPSVHPSGRRYRWRPGHEPETLMPAAMPLWLLRLAGGAGRLRGHSSEYWRSLVAGGVSEGSRNSTIASLAGHLLWHGVDVGVVSELLLCWNRQLCRPPLSDEEVSRTVASIARLHARIADAGDGGPSEA
jgi:hypothetical protein